MKVAVCLWVRNEEADISEWIAFHLAVGFDTCIVMDNGSTDRTIRHARRFSGDDRVRINQRAPDNQTLSYDQCLGKHGRDFDWIAFLDSDEFFVPRQGGVKDVLTLHDDAVAIAVSWAIYGSSGYIDPPQGLITESLCRRAEDGFEPNRHIKSFVRPSRVLKCLSPHAFSVDGCYIDPTGAPVEWDDPLGVRRGAPVYATCQINHYFLRSRTHWTAKLKRGYHDDAWRHPVDDFIRYDRNEVEDDSALRFVSATKTILAEAKALPPSRSLAGDAEPDKAAAPARDRAA